MNFNGQAGPLESVDCDLCGGREKSLLLIKYRKDKIIGIAGYWQIVKCNKCGLIFVSPRLIPESAANRYERIYFSYYEDNPIDRYQSCAGSFKIIKKYFPPGFKGRILDVGCGLGYFVEYLQNNGWDARGIEVSKYAADSAENKGLNVISGDFLKIEYPLNHFDCITMWDAIEHVPYPMRYVKQAYKLLKPGGMLIIQTPNIENLTLLLNKNMYPWAPTEHLFYFSIKTLRLLLEKNNYEIIEQKTFGNMNWIFDRLSEKEQLQDIHRQEAEAMGEAKRSKAVQSLRSLAFRIINKVSALTKHGEVLLVAARKIE